MPFLQLEGLWIFNLGKCQPSQNAKKKKFKASKYVKMNVRFWTSKIPEIDFTEKLSGRKILKFPHCDFISLESFSYSHSTRHLNFFLKKLCRVLRVRLFDHYILETLLEDMLEMKNFFLEKNESSVRVEKWVPCFERPKISCSLVIVLFFQVYLSF